MVWSLTGPSVSMMVVASKPLPVRFQAHIGNVDPVGQKGGAPPLHNALLIPVFEG